MFTNTLLKITAGSADTELGKQWGLGKVQTVEHNRQNVPLTNYEVYKQYIDRMAQNGEENLIAPGKVVFFAPTSGTTSKSKLFPRFSLPPQLPLRYKRSMLLFCWHRYAATPSGVPITPANTAVIGATIEANPTAYAAPPEAYRIQDLGTALYVQLVFGLKDCTLESIWSPFCPTALTAFTLLKQEWKQMVHDIRSGTLRTNLTEVQRKALERAMEGPDYKRADELQTIFEKNTGIESIAKLLWPELRIVDALAGGPLSVNVEALQKYLGADVHLFSSVYAASEGPGIFGVNEWPFDRERTSAYTLQTKKVFYEFIPQADVDANNPKVLLAEETEIGEVYEIVITTTEGLYRYRIGDLIKVLEFSPDGSPVVDIMGRTKMTLSLHGEKLQEFHLTAAMSSLCKGPWKHHTITDFTVTAHFECFPPQHNFWIEVSTENPSALSAIDLKSCATFLDEQLAEVHPSYAGGRAQNMINLPKITLVATGTFSTLRTKLKQSSPVTETQIKIPRIITDLELTKVLQSNAIL